MLSEHITQERRKIKCKSLVKQYLFNRDVELMFKLHWLTKYECEFDWGSVPKQCIKEKLVFISYWKLNSALHRSWFQHFAVVFHLFVVVFFLFAGVFIFCDWLALQGLHVFSVWLWFDDMVYYCVPLVLFCIKRLKSRWMLRSMEHFDTLAWWADGTQWVYMLGHKDTTAGFLCTCKCSSMMCIHRWGCRLVRLKEDLPYRQ